MKKILLLVLSLLIAPLLFADTPVATNTNFPATESPISTQGGVSWINGSTNGGLNWGDVATSPGLAHGTTTTGGCSFGSGNCNDSTALINAAFQQNQVACGVVSLNGSLSRNTGFLEIELRINSTITSSSNTGYELTFSTHASGSSPYIQINRWNGPKNNFTLLNSLAPTTQMTNGQVVCLTRVGTTLQVYLDGIAQFTGGNAINDSTYLGGAPGMGFFNQGGAPSDNLLFGWSNFFAYSQSSGAIRISPTCNVSDVSTQIAAAVSGDMIFIPAGSCTWASGVTISGKGIKLFGMGSGRIIAGDNNTETITIGTGSKSFIVSNYSPGFSASVWTPGATIRTWHNNDRANFMQGTVTSYTAGTQTLVLNVTSSGGSGTWHQWIFGTVPTTIITDNASGTMFDMTETSAASIQVSDFKIAKGTSPGTVMLWTASASGKPTLVHDMWFEQQTADMIDTTTNKGVIWNVSADCSTATNVPLGTGNLCTTAFLRIKGGANTWTSIAKWGSLDTNGDQCIYTETSDFHAYQAFTDNDDNGCMVMRYNWIDHTTFSTHGADTSNTGQRRFEYYNNRNTYKEFSDGTSMNLANGWLGLIRGGTFVAHDNTWDSISGGSDFGTKQDVVLTVMNLGRNGGPNACWAINTTGGVQYPAPRQVGRGFVTGSGTDGLGRTNDSITYVGDLEPIYMWSNSRIPTINISDFTPPTCAGTPDLSANYIQAGRDYFTNTSKPGYTPFVYPHPLTSGAATPSLSFLPNPIAFASQLSGTTSSGLTTTITNNGSANEVLSTPFFTITGTNATDFARTGGTCANSGTIALGGGSCTIIQTFTPGAVGSRTATLNVNGTANFSANITGTGTGAGTPSVAFAPTSLTFAPQLALTTSPIQIIVLSNPGTATLTITSIGVSAPFAHTHNCGASLGAGLSCSISITFTPVGGGQSTGLLTVVDNASGSPHTATLTGTGVGTVSGIGSINIQGNVQINP